MSVSIKVFVMVLVRGESKLGCQGGRRSRPNGSERTPCKPRESEAGEPRRWWEPGREGNPRRPVRGRMPGEPRGYCAKRRMVS